MNLTDQKVSGVDEISLQDSLNAAVLGIKIKMGATTVAPNSNDLIIFVDTQSQSNPTNDRKQYVFNLEEPLKYASGEGDEIVQKIVFENNNVKLKATANRIIGENNVVLNTPVEEELDSMDITLFEGTNYIYTNYENAEIVLIYPKDNDLNRIFLNTAIYNRHNEDCESDFTLDDIYFKDAFTKMGDALNLEVDNLNVGCITSKNNTFSLDAQGNLIVNSITMGQGLQIGGSIGNFLYPVGSIYLSVNDTNPSILFGGTWEQITGDAYLKIATGTTAGNLGGTSSEHKIPVSSMPSHKHTMTTCYPVTTTSSTQGYAAKGHNYVYFPGVSGFPDMTYTGGGEAYYPYYYDIFVWKRTA